MKLEIPFLLVFQTKGSTLRFWKPTMGEWKNSQLSGSLSLIWWKGCSQMFMVESSLKTLISMEMMLFVSSNTSSKQMILKNCLFGRFSLSTFFVLSLYPFLTSLSVSYQWDLQNPCVKKEETLSLKTEIGKWTKRFLS